MSSRSLSIVGLLLARVITLYRAVRCRRVLYRSLAYFSPASSLSNVPSDVVAFSIDRWPTSCLRRHSLACRPMSCVLYRSLAYFVPASSLANVPSDVVPFSIDRRPYFSHLLVVATRSPRCIDIAASLTSRQASW